MFPEEFITRIQGQPYINAGALLKSFDRPEPVSIRINTTKWKNTPAEGTQVAWCDTGWYIDRRPSFTLDPLFHSGCYYPQEASGMFIGKVFSDVTKQQTGLRVLDLCGAPGGKSTHIASLLGKNGFIVANEVIRQRASVLAETLTKWGAGNAILTQSDPEVLGRMNGFFDVILVDAPCSGEGMFRDEVARKEWSAENAYHCSERQKRILMDIWPALKENGILIYSTCTFNPEENEINIKWLTDQTNSECITVDISEFATIEKIEYMGIEGYGFYPDKLAGNGLFVSVVRKLDKSEASPKSHSVKKENAVTRSDLKIAAEWTSFSGDNIFRAGEELYGITAPLEDFLTLRSRTRIIKAGTHICSVKRSDYIPVHDLVLSEYIGNNAFPVCEADYNQAVAFLRRDNPVFRNLTRGWHVVRYEGVNAGLIKNIGTRINNYYPVDWRIRMNAAIEGEENLIAWASG